MFRYRILTPVSIFIFLFALISLYSPDTSVSADTASDEDEAALITLPLDQSSFKIKVPEDGIYELSYSALEAAGMDVAAANPQKFELMHRGEAVAYSFVGDSDTKFESGEKLLFFGSAFDGSDYEKQYIDSNYYWLWANGSPTVMTAVANSSNKPASAAWRASVTTGDDLIFNTGNFRWDENQVNEPDAWFWKVVKSGTPDTLVVSLPHPATGSGDADISAEFLTTYKSNNLHDVSFKFGSAPEMSKNVYAPRTERITGTLSANLISNGDNNVVASISSPSTNDYIMVDQITVDYWRKFIADDNQLIFNAQDAASKSFTITGLSGVTAANMLVWDVTDPLAATAITIGAGDVTGSSVSFERNTPQDERNFIVTKDSNIKSPAAIEKYDAANIEPAAGAEWLAISHENFIDETHRLANYRQDIRGMSSHVVDVKDVINQYGYGYNMPDSIHTFIKQAYDNWSTTPGYVLLVGDATQNPLQRDCTHAFCYSGWDPSIETYIVTDLTHEDRFLGLTPSDHIYATVSGDDILPDLAVGRMAVRDNAALATIIDKTIRYEEAVYANEPWTKNMMWLADDTDKGGQFCKANELVRDNLPEGFEHTEICLGNYYTDDPALNDASTAHKTEARTDFFNKMNSSSAGIVNYRGHGSFSDWGADMISRDNANLWQNSDNPTVILSADCLDSNFAWVDKAQSISETFMQIDHGGSVAHWGSTGLGFTSEHSALHSAFYNAIFNGSAERFGDATNASKKAYINGNYDLSEVHAFTLHGDPALRMIAEEPILPDPSFSDFGVMAANSALDNANGSTNQFEIMLFNTGNVAESFTLVISGNGWEATISASSINLAPHSHQTIDLTHLIPEGATLGASDSVVVTVTSSNSQVTKTVTVTSTVDEVEEVPAGDGVIYLPMILNK